MKYEKVAKIFASRWRLLPCISVALMISACGMGPSDQATGEEVLDQQSAALSDTSVLDGNVAPAWSRCERSNTTVRAYTTSYGSASWGTYPAGLTFYHLGEANGRFRNWWGPGDPFPGQGEAWINLYQTTTVPCPW